MKKRVTKESDKNGTDIKRELSEIILTIRKSSLSPSYMSECLESELDQEQRNESNLI